MTKFLEQIICNGAKGKKPVYKLPKLGFNHEMKVHCVKVVVRQCCGASSALVECERNHHIQKPVISITTAAAFCGVGLSFAVRNN